MPQTYATRTISVFGKGACLVGMIALAGCAVETDPVTPQSRLAQSALDRETMFADQEPANRPISLYDAMARAITYNLDRRLKVAEEALALNRVDVARYSLLPRVVANAGFRHRDKEDASVSRSIATQQQSLEASKSDDRDVWDLDSTLSWNLLDFGVSYFEAKQNSDRAHVAQERTRKVVHNLLQDVRFAYWRAAAAQILGDKIAPVIERAEKALENTYTIERENLQPALQTLQFQKTLLEIVRLLESLRDELRQAHTELGSLMNMTPGKPFELAETGTLIPPTEFENADVSMLENVALTSRPELYEADYQERISLDEVHKSMVRLFPGLDLRLGKNYTSNSFTINKNWVEAGAAFSLNLIDLAAGPSQIELSKAQVAVSNSQRLALSMAILSQVHLSHQQYLSLLAQFERSRKLREVNNKIAEHLKKVRSGRAESEIKEIRAETASITSELDEYKTFAALQNALGRIHASVGLDPLPKSLKDAKLATLANAIEAKYRVWTAKGLPKPPKPPAKEAEPASEGGMFGWVKSLFD